MKVEIGAIGQFVSVEAASHYMTSCSSAFGKFLPART